ncbi:MAG TPA: GtrA family protein [Gemmatimonadaceae bacterium]|nr:GtrA family protein [Gemmatimonadaceae bacterium]
MSRRPSARAGGAFARFLVVGVSNTAVSFVVYVALLRLLRPVDARVPLAQLASYGAGIAWSYGWNRRWTFASRGPHRREATRFVTSQLLAMIGSAALLTALVEGAGIGPRLGWCLVMGLVTVVNFLVLRLWVFAPSLDHPT